MATQTKILPLTVSNPWWGHDPSDKQLKPESTEGRSWGQPLKKPEGAPLNLG